MKNTNNVERAKKNWTQAELADKISVSSRPLILSRRVNLFLQTVLALKMAKVFGTMGEVIFQLEKTD